MGRKKVRALGPPVGEKMGVNFFLSHPLPQKPQSFDVRFSACDLEFTRAKNPENFSKIVNRVFEIFRDLYVESMAPIGQGTKTLHRSLLMLLDTPSHCESKKGPVYFCM